MRRTTSEREQWLPRLDRIVSGYRPKKREYGVWPETRWVLPPEVAKYCTHYEREIKRRTSGDTTSAGPPTKIAYKAFHGSGTTIVRYHFPSCKRGTLIGTKSVRTPENRDIFPCKTKNSWCRGSRGTRCKGETRIAINCYQNL